MGGAETSATALPATNDEVASKRTARHIFKSICKWGWKKKGKNKSNHAEPEAPPSEEVRPPPQPVVAASVVSVLKEMKKLSLNKETGEAEEHKGLREEIKDNFEFKTIEVKDDNRKPSCTSNGSKDSGFSGRSVEANKDDDDFVEVFANVSIGDKLDKERKEEKKEKEEKQEKEERQEKEEKKEKEEKVEGKKKKLHTLLVSRGPIRSSVVHGEFCGTHPYQQINQVNKQSLSGGQIIVNAAPVQPYTAPAPAYIDLYTEDLEILAPALQSVGENVINYPTITDDELNEWFKDAETYVSKQRETEAEVPFSPVCETWEPKPIREFTNINEPSHKENQYVLPEYRDPFLTNVILTPPRSNEVSYPSPLSHYSPQPAHSPCIYETGHSPLTDSDHSQNTLSPNAFFGGEEPYQDIPFVDGSEIPTMVADMPTPTQSNPRQARTAVRKSSLAMRDIKLKLNDMRAQFSKEYCCKGMPQPDEVFKNHCDALPAATRKNLCLKLAAMDFEGLYGLLSCVLKELSRDACLKESLHYAMFYLACRQALERRPQLYLGRFGFDLLVAAAIQCRARPELTGLLVSCIHVADAANAAAVAVNAANASPIFTEVDSNGDTLVAACARGGDRFAPVLAALALRPAGGRPLFDVERANVDGYTALHTACLAHNSAEAGSCLRVVHTLLAHAGADLSKGDNKAGDTALHLAANSVHCELRLVLALLLHVERPVWNTFAHQRNKSHKTPLDYARQAAKSKVRQNYPIEVLDLLLKCR